MVLGLVDLWSKLLLVILIKVYSTVYLFWYYDVVYVTDYLICTIILKLMLFSSASIAIAYQRSYYIKVTHIFYRFVRKFIIMNMLVMSQ